MTHPPFQRGGPPLVLGYLWLTWPCPFYPKWWVFWTPHQPLLLQGACLDWGARVPGALPAPVQASGHSKALDVLSTMQIPGLPLAPHHLWLLCSRQQPRGCQQLCKQQLGLGQWAGFLWSSSPHLPILPLPLSLTLLVASDPGPAGPQGAGPGPPTHLTRPPPPMSLLTSVRTTCSISGALHLPHRATPIHTWDRAHCPEGS